MGLLLPLLWEAARVARLVEWQQRQRAAAGLPPQSRADAWLCAGGARAVVGQGSRACATLGCWALLALTWNACVLWFAHA